MITVKLSEICQPIDGFGASSAWMNSLTPAQAELFFSTKNGIAYTDNLGNQTTNNGIGLSLLRNHIVPANTTTANDTPTTTETSIMQAAQGYGARVWSTPWTPAAGFKDSGVLNGGHYLGSGGNATNLAYASQLANYVASMKKQGIKLYAISIQNEPDGNHPDPNGYESCVWTPQQIHDFVPCLYTKLADAGVGSTKIMLPESENWTDPQGLAAIAMNDPNVAANVGIIANHDYVANNNLGDQNVPTAVNAYGQALWESEVALLSGNDSTMTNALYWAIRIHQFLTEAQANAYHYWWLIDIEGTGSQGLLDHNASITKRLFVFGQFSRFIRPGYVRVSVPPAGNVGWSGNALVSAYVDAESGSFVIVAINYSGVDIPYESFEAPEFVIRSSHPGYPVRWDKYVPTSVTPWVTTSALSLASQTAVPIVNSTFTYKLPANSVVTFEGRSEFIR